MKVLVSDKMEEAGISILRNEEGIEVDVKTGLSPEQLKEIIGDYDALAVRSATRVTQEILDAAVNLKVIARAGIGLDNVDIAYATRKGVAVMNTPGGNTVTTAEHSIAMMMALTRNIPRGTITMKQGLWEKKKLQGREISNKTLGIIGYGNIGSIVASRALGLKMNVIVFDPNITADRLEEEGYESVSLEELYKRSDYISIHVPKLDSTTNLVNRQAFESMKPGVMLINCSRGGIVNESDLYSAIVSGKVAGAALDVFETEPPGQIPLLGLDQVIATPHLGASTLEAQTNVAVAAAGQIVSFLKHGSVINAVNMPSVTGKILEKLQPLLLLAEKTGVMQSQMARGAIKSVTVEYAGDFPDMDLKPVTVAAVKGLLAPFVKYEVNSVNAASFAKDMGIKVSEIVSQETENFTNLIRVTVESGETENLVAGTIFGRSDPRIVRINKFRLEVIPEGHLGLIHNIDKPGSIGSIGMTLGRHDINIARMMVGKEDDGDRNIIFLRTDSPIPDDVIKEISNLELVNSMVTFEL
ncbi:MAG: phosphoglycerate dehydrogenase [Desulfobacteraceae bacterium]